MLPSSGHRAANTAAISLAAESYHYQNMPSQFMARGGGPKRRIRQAGDKQVSEFKMFKFWQTQSTAVPGEQRISMIRQTRSKAESKPQEWLAQTDMMKIWCWTKGNVENLYWERWSQTRSRCGNQWLKGCWDTTAGSNYMYIWGQTLQNKTGSKVTKVQEIYRSKKTTARHKKQETKWQSPNQNNKKTHRKWEMQFCMPLNPSGLFGLIGIIFQQEEPLIWYENDYYDW